MASTAVVTRHGDDYHVTHHNVQLTFPVAGVTSLLIDLYYHVNQGWAALSHIDPDLTQHTSWHRTIVLVLIYSAGRRVVPVKWGAWLLTPGWGVPGPDYQVDVSPFTLKLIARYLPNSCPVTTIAIPAEIATHPLPTVGLQLALHHHRYQEVLSWLCTGGVLLQWLYPPSHPIPDDVQHIITQQWSPFEHQSLTIWLARCRPSKWTLSHPIPVVEVIPRPRDNTWLLDSWLMNPENIPVAMMTEWMRKHIRNKYQRHSISILAKVWCIDQLLPATPTLEQIQMAVTHTIGGMIDASLQPLTQHHPNIYYHPTHLTLHYVHGNASTALYIKWLLLRIHPRDIPVVMRKAIQAYMSVPQCYYHCMNIDALTQWFTTFTT